MNLKNGFNASNHNINYLPQVITVQRLIFCFQFIDLNLQTLTQHREKSSAACKVLPSGTDLAAPQSSESYVKPIFLGPQNRCDGKQPNAISKGFRALLDNTQDSMYCMAICSCTWEFMKYKSHNKRYISAEQLHAMECEIPTVFRSQLKVSMVNACLRCVNAQQARAGAEGIDRITGSGYTNPWGGGMVRRMGISCGNCNNDSKSGA